MHALPSPMNSTIVRSVVAHGWTRARFALAAALAPESALEAAARRFLSPPRIPHSDREKRALASGRGFAVATPAGRVAAWSFGPGDRPAVVLSHGWGGRGAQLRAFVGPIVDAGWQAVLFDHPAHGLSEGHESSLVHFERALAAVAADLESRGIPVAGAIGHSLGAAAIGAWLNRSARATRAVLIAPPHSIERYSGLFARAIGIPEAIRRGMQERIERSLGVAWQRYELPQSVASIRAPALVVHDAHDREVSAASGLAIARAWPGARFLSTSGLGHRAIVRDPGVVRDAIDFLAGEVVFAPPPAHDEWSAFPGPAPLL